MTTPRSLPLWSALAALMLWSLPATSQAAELPESPACQAALQALQAQESAASAALRSGPVPGAKLAQRSAPAAVQNARRRATQACLGGPDDLPPPQRVLQAPVTVPPVALTPQPALRAARQGQPLPAITSPGLATPRPTSVTSCDANGCWANDGSRLNRIGPNLVGQRGICTTQGSLLHCP